MAFKKLSILFMKDGFSFCVLKDNELLHAQEVVYPLSSDNLKDKLSSNFDQQLYLSQQYDIVYSCYLTNQFNLIPNQYYNADQDAHKWLEFSSEIFVDDEVDSILLNRLDTHIVYAIPKELKQFVQHKYPETTILNASSVFLENISATDETSLFLNVHSSSIEVAIFTNQKLKLYNIFDTSTKEDIVYYVLNCIQTLGLDANTIMLYYFGWKIDDPSLKMLMNFVRHVMPGSSNIVELQNFTKIHSIV